MFCAKIIFSTRDKIMAANFYREYVEELKLFTKIKILTLICGAHLIILMTHKCAVRDLCFNKFIHFFLQDIND